jgi:hypothetical protein
MYLAQLRYSSKNLRIDKPYIMYSSTCIQIRSCAGIHDRRFFNSKVFGWVHDPIWVHLWQSLLWLSRMPWWWWEKLPSAPISLEMLCFLVGVCVFRSYPHPSLTSVFVLLLFLVYVLWKCESNLRFRVPFVSVLAHLWEKIFNSLFRIINHPHFCIS